MPEHGKDVKKYVTGKLPRRLSFLSWLATNFEKLRSVSPFFHVNYWMRTLKEIRDVPEANRQLQTLGHIHRVSSDNGKAPSHATKDIQCNCFLMKHSTLVWFTLLRSQNYFFFKRCDFSKQLFVYVNMALRLMCLHVMHVNLVASLRPI